MADPSGVVRSQFTASSGVLGTGGYLVTTSGTFIHTCVTSSNLTAGNSYDEITLYVQNQNSAGQTVTVGVGSSAVRDLITTNVPANSGPMLIVPGYIVQGTSRQVYVSASTPSAIVAFGWASIYSS